MEPNASVDTAWLTLNRCKLFSLMRDSTQRQLVNSAPIIRIRGGGMVAEWAHGRRSDFVCSSAPPAFGHNTLQHWQKNAFTQSKFCFYCDCLFWDFNVHLWIFFASNLLLTKTFCIALLKQIHAFCFKDPFNYRSVLLQWHFAFPYIGHKFMLFLENITFWILLYALLASAFIKFHPFKITAFKFLNYYFLIYM